MHGRQPEALHSETRRLWVHRHEAGCEPSVWRERRPKKKEKRQCRLQIRLQTTGERRHYIREQFYTTKRSSAYLKRTGAAVFSDDVTAAVKRADGAAGLGKVVRFLASSRGRSGCAGVPVGVSTVREFTGDTASILERRN